jgi:DNA-binding NarL/FixJ family response regulator
MLQALSSWRILGDETLMPKIRILLTDDHTLFRQGIKTLIAAETDMEVVGEAANGTDAVIRAAETRPDIVLMDIGMTGLSSFEATRQIKKNRAETKILFLTMYDDEDYLVECMQVGAGGYVLKDSPAAQLLGAIREVQRGGSYLSPRMLSQLVDGLPLTREIDPADASLRHPDDSRKGSAQGPGRRQLRQGDRRRIEPQRQDRRSAQVQPDAQTRHPQQGQLVQYAIQKKIIQIPSVSV